MATRYATCQECGKSVPGMLGFVICGDRCFDARQERIRREDEALEKALEEE